MNPRYSLVLAALAALATIVSMAGHMKDITAQNQTITASSLLLDGASVLFEGPTALILQGRVPSDLGQPIDTGIQNGYKVDSVTVFTEEDPGTYSVTLTPVHTVFMSK